MFGSAQNIWKIGDLRNRILFTLLMFTIFRLGVHIPAPGLNADKIQSLFSNNLGMFVDIMSGGALKKLSIFAMGIMPYITASIILSLLQVVIPKLEQLKKEGNEGQKKINQWTRYGTVGLAFFQALIMAYAFGRSGALHRNGAEYVFLAAITMTTGTIFLMWLGEQITEKGIGNGISLVIFAGIVSRVPQMFGTLWQYGTAGTVNWLTILLFLVLVIVLVAVVIAILQAQRRIPVQYAKRVVGRKVYSGTNSHIPLKINQAGVMPIIFASSILMIPSQLSQWTGVGWLRSLGGFFDIGSPVYLLLYFVLVLAFTYFYTSITFNVGDVADNMKKYGGFIPGLRPGKPTADYLGRVMGRVTLMGAVFLGLIAVLPYLIGDAMALNVMSWGFGGTSILICIGVALDTMRQIESQMLMRHYQGFMK